VRVGIVLQAALAAAALWGALPVASGPNCSAQEKRAPVWIIRKVRVLAACDEEYRRAAKARGLDWRQEAVARVNQASAAYERELGVRWSTVDVVAWTSDDDAPSLDDLCSALERDVPPGDADVVFGLSGQSAPRGGRRYGFWGWSRLFGRALVASAFRPDSWPSHEAHTLAHEMGHLFGAWHCNEPRTIMTARSCDYERFDPCAASVVRLTRGYDFKRGIDGIERPTIDALDALWRAGHAPDAGQPVAEAFATRAWSRLDASLLDDAERDFRRATEIWERCLGGEGPEMVGPLVGLATVCAQRTPRDSVRELERAQRANRLAVAAGSEEEPVAASFVALARAQWANGAAAESITSYRRAFDLRRAALGADDPLTQQARNGLAFFARRGHAAAKSALAAPQGASAGGM
jgi:hypothetical protein